MHFSLFDFPKILVLLICVIQNQAISNNLTCYQCIRNTNTECAPEELLPCPPVSDRCVTHISKDDERGFIMKRECGLGPCGFDDIMVNKGLGLLDKCDTSRKEYFCVFCCRESGCNKNNSGFHVNLNGFVICFSVFILLIYK